MKLIWQIVRKDIRRLRVPLGLWLLWMVLRMFFFAAISGLFGPARWYWMDLIQQPLVVMLRATIDPLVAYLVVGSMVFADSLVERDAFWITRPISGGQLLLAKLFGVGLTCVLLPVLSSLPWWLACGLGLREIGIAAGLQALPFLVGAVAGLTVASITDGFPRYLLWTLAGLGAIAVNQMAVAFLIAATSDNPSLGATWFGMATLGVILAALVVIVHQYVTRRMRRSIVLLVVGMVLASVAGRMIPWDLGWLVRQQWGDNTQPGDDRIQIRTTGSAYFQADPKFPRVWIPLSVEGLPDDAVPVVDLHGEWDWNGAANWKSAGGLWQNLPKPEEMVRRTMHLPIADPAAPINVGLPLSPVLAERMEREPSSFHGLATLTINHGIIKAEMPLRDRTVRNAYGSYSIRDVQQSGNHLQLTFTGRTLAFDREVAHPVSRDILALVRRSDGQVLLAGINSGASYALVDSVVVLSHFLEFKSPSDARWFDDAVLVLIEFGQGHDIKRTLIIDRFQLTAETAPGVPHDP